MRLYTLTITSYRVLATSMVLLRIDPGINFIRYSGIRLRVEYCSFTVADNSFGNPKMEAADLEAFLFTIMLIEKRYIERVDLRVQ